MRSKRTSAEKAMTEWATFTVLILQQRDGAFTRYAAFLFVLAGIGVILSIWALGKTLARKRTEALQNAAMMIGFTFGGEEWPDKGRAPKLGTELFGKGHSRQIKNIMTGTGGGLRISLFDYAYTIGSGKNSQTYRQSVASFSKDDASLPYFALRPANVLDKAWDAVAHKNIHFEAAPEFARRYVLRGALPEKVQELFTPGLISFAEGLDAREKWHIEGAGDTLVVYRLSKKVAPEKLRDFLDQTSAIASGFFSFAATPAAAVPSSNW